MFRCNNAVYGTTSQSTDVSMSPRAPEFIAYLLELLLPGGIAIQETSVSNSSDCSDVWAVINVRSLCNKLDEFHFCLSDRNIDVCCVTETLAQQ